MLPFGKKKELRHLNGISQSILPGHCVGVKLVRMNCKVMDLNGNSSANILSLPNLCLPGVPYCRGKWRAKRICTGLWYSQEQQR